MFERVTYEELVQGYVISLGKRHYPKMELTSKELTSDYIVLFDSEGHYDNYDGSVSEKRYVMTRTKKQLILDQKGYSEAFVNTLRNNDEMLIDLITLFVNTMQIHYHPHMISTRYDLVMDCYLKWKKNGYIDKFDGQITSPEYFIKIGVRNFLIDCERKKRIHPQSLDIQFDGKESNLLDRLDIASSLMLVEDYMAEESLTLDMLMEKLQLESSWGIKIGETPLLGEQRLSHYAVVHHWRQGYEFDEIAKMFTISINRTRGIVQEAVQKMQSYMLEI